MSSSPSQVEEDERGDGVERGKEVRQGSRSRLKRRRQGAT